MEIVCRALLFYDVVSKRMQESCQFRILEQEHVLYSGQRPAKSRSYVPGLPLLWSVQQPTGICYLFTAEQTDTLSYKIFPMYSFRYLFPVSSKGRKKYNKMETTFLKLLFQFMSHKKIYVVEYLPY